MKKVLFIVFIFPLVFFSCENRPSLYEIRKEKSISGIENDSAMFGILLGDTKEIVLAKLLTSNSYNDITGYEFLDESLNGVKFKFHQFQAFHNDSLISFETRAKVYDFQKDRIIESLLNIYTSKYGTPNYQDKNSYYWIEKNREIQISSSKYVDDYYVEISYYRPWKYNIEKYKYDDAVNSFSKKYWEEHYKSKSDSIKNSNIQKINSDI